MAHPSGVFPRVIDPGMATRLAPDAVSPTFPVALVYLAASPAALVQLTRKAKIRPTMTCR